MDWMWFCLTRAYDYVCALSWENPKVCDMWFYTAPIQPSLCAHDSAQHAPEHASHASTILLRRCQNHSCTERKG